MFLIKKCQLTVTLVLALATLGGMTLIGSFILAKAIDIAGIIMHDIKLNMANVNTALRFIYTYVPFHIKLPSLENIQ
jgi:hypothetical protein